jgi:hypothetical protein
MKCHQKELVEVIKSREKVVKSHQKCEERRSWVNRCHEVGVSGKKSVRSQEQNKTRTKKKLRFTTRSFPLIQVNFETRMTRSMIGHSSSHPGRNISMVGAFIAP